MSTKQRRLAIIKDEREKARTAFPDEPVSDDPEASSSKARPATTAGLEDEFSNIPLMPVAPCVGNRSKEETVEDALDIVVLPALSANSEIGQHRCKVLQAHLHPVIHAMVARRLKAMLMLKSLLTWSGATLRARAHRITTLCVSGRRWSKKLRGEVERSMLAK